MNSKDSPKLIKSNSPIIMKTEMHTCLRLTFYFSLVQSNLLLGINTGCHTEVFNYVSQLLINYPGRVKILLGKSDWDLPKDQWHKILTLSQTSPSFHLFAVEAFWKHCGKRRNCLQRAISPFPTVFSTKFRDFSAIFIKPFQFGRV